MKAAKDSVRKRIAAITKGFPADVRRLTLANVRKLETFVDLELEQISRLIGNASAPEEPRSIAVWLAGILGFESVAPHLEVIVGGESSTSLKWEAAKALCSLRQGFELFKTLLTESEDAGSRKIAAYALGCLGDQKASQALCTVLADISEAPDVRGQAAEALGYLLDPATFECLVKGTSDAEPEVRFWSVFALGQLRDARARNLLERIESTDNGLVEGWGTIAEEAREALAHLDK